MGLNIFRQNRLIIILEVELKINKFVMSPINALQRGAFYHVFNKGVNGVDLFYTPENYRYFLALYDKYVSPIADTYAYCLLRNHFHFLVRIKNFDEIDLRCLPVPVKVLQLDGERNLNVREPHLYFSDFFNAYAQAINKQINRKGVLFERPFKRIAISKESYLKNLVVYIHNNPIKHGFASSCSEYLWSSYSAFTNALHGRILVNEVMELFGGEECFFHSHRILPEKKEFTHEFFIE